MWPELQGEIGVRVHAAATGIYPGGSLADLRRRMAFKFRAWRERTELVALLEPDRDGTFMAAVRHDPNILGVVVWPYIDRRWTPARRLQEMAAHYRELAALPAALHLANGEIRPLLDLGALAPGLTLTIERQPFFSREGQLMLCLSNHELRLFTAAFAFTRIDGVLSVYLGAVQGLNSDAARDIYRDLTKAAHGLRPRDLLLELFSGFCASAGVATIHAVSDENRLHKSNYFGAIRLEQLHTNYNEIWAEQGAVVADSGFHAMPTVFAPKAMEDIPSKKRSMYRKRFEFLAQARSDLTVAIGSQAAA